MAGQRVSVDLRVPVRPDTITRLLEEEGFEVDGVTEMRGPVFAADAISFIVERLDDAVVPVLVGVVTKLMAMRRSRNSPNSSPDSSSDSSSDEDEVTFSIRGEDIGDIVVINVTGDGNWVQVHPKPSDEEE